MRPAHRAALLALLAVASTTMPAVAADQLWLMSAKDWRQRSAAERLELVRAYMLSFCARPTMSAQQVLACVNHRSRSLPGTTAMFDVASECVLAAN